MTSVITPAGVAEAAPAPAGPRATLQVLRVVSVLHALALALQPVLAGVYLDGDIDGIGWHAANAFVVAGLDVVQLICAFVYVWPGRGRWWPVWTSLAIAIIVEVQVGFGYERMLAVHVPLGVSIIVSQIVLTVWLFRPGAAVARIRRRERRP
jgi:hypothetical protein